MNNENLRTAARCEAGERALRKFWEAKSCAKREHGSNPHRHRSRSASPCDGE